MYLFLISFLISAQSRPVFFYFDDGGEHNYFKSCQKWTGPANDWKEIQRKLTNADLKKHFLGKIFSQGKLTNTVEYYFDDEALCNESLKKASQWFKKESKKPKD